ncbi:hypothetical protein GCM10011515_08440 [Tsuneonella deserti]|uniref:Transposase n=1 Tax=Tsuneonella deserti TaxID=2035528 RepID=A0ABQ1S572_9SPHN|nr:hypothetical protein [Tsuneonella deserti]GGD91073.1 hypothetical protein GCM10011515_08440 [Tsuneonella deserti]
MGTLRLSSEHVATIAAVVRGEPDDELINWEKIREISKSVVGKHFTRQTLQSHEPIKSAYNDRVAAFRKRKRTKRKEVVKLGDPKDRRIASLEQEIEALRSKLNAYDARFVLILENTKRLGFQREELARALPATS